MAMERLLRMKEGVGETSYAKNSLIPKKVIMKVKTLLDENLLKLMVSKKTLNGCWKIADLGCSSGPNTLMAISNILNTIHKSSFKLNHKKLVFQIYLNDLFENDFNNIFKLLPDFHQSMQHETGENVGACFVNATPGSFYGRLFPNYSIDIFHSSYCVHWLSQAPIYSKKKTEPLIKGNIYITRVSPPSVYDVYLEHFERDFNNFLKSRYEELALDGVMVLTFIGRENNGEITSYEVLGMVLNQMVQEGLVEEAKLDLFNVPIYHPSIEEVKQVIKAEGSFTIKTLKTFKIGWDANLQEDINDYIVDSKTRGEFISKYHRAVFESLLIAQFGENIMDELFSRFSKLIIQFIELKSPDFTNIVLFMTKNS
ncbi:probable caffeine synthase MTL2 [Cicer arietinum]|uniref:7-methylxanthosine synthase 1-like n=1 Tax=Cicer arietinum TaxID=3827 RepID=A0A1S2XWY4_CICAR|nr:7-methylxanthosine synthase 1-like [Cicer arietinum]